MAGVQTLGSPCPACCVSRGSTYTLCAAWGPGGGVAGLSASPAWSWKEDSMQNVRDGKTHEPGGWKGPPRVPKVLLQSMLTGILGLGHLKGVAFG